MSLEGPLLFVGAILTILGGLAAADSGDAGGMDDPGCLVAIIGVVLIIIGLSL